MTYVIKKSTFDLISFNSDNVPKIKIGGDISRTGNQLKITYLLTGDRAAIIVPEANQVPIRRYDLWEHTCFELFLRLKGTNKYWEFNLSPSGNWNVFRFLDYRLNIMEELSFDSLPFKVVQDAESLKVMANINLDTLGIAKRDLNIAITTVVENTERQLSYWALAHPTTEADFHHQDSFIISL